MRNIFCLLLIAVVSLLTLVPYVGAEVTAGHTIISEYRSPVPGRAVNVVRWQFTNTLSGVNGYMTEIEDLDQKVGCRSELFYGPSHRLEQADCFRWVKGAEVCSANQYDAKKPALLNATIIPGDWLNRSLPFAYEANKRDVVIYEQVGTTRFANYLEIQDREISRAEAFSEGMIRDDLQAGIAVAGRLYLVEVRRAGGSGDNNDLLLQQLWRSGDNFWLYESKAGRRSWRALQK